MKSDVKGTQALVKLWIVPPFNLTHYLITHCAGLTNANLSIRAKILVTVRIYGKILHANALDHIWVTDVNMNILVRML